LAYVLPAYPNTALLAYHDVLMIILAASSVVLGTQILGYDNIEHKLTRAALLLAGCTSSTGAMSNIYILGLNYNTSVETGSNATSQLSVRVGYFGICAQRSVETQWFCASGQQGIRSVVVEGDPLGLIDIGARFKSDVIFSGLM
jgi:hypothetical protein